MNNILGAAEVEAVTQVAEALAGKSDRYLMIVAIVLLVAFLVWVVRYMLTWNEKQAAKVEGITAEYNKAVTQMTVSMDRNTEALDGCTEFMRRVEGKL
jgi:flagellar basal body-associated protein FliL